MEKTMEKNLNDFALDVCNALEAKVEGEKFESVDVNKNNNTLLKGIIIKTEGKNISPTVYINDFYQEYIDGREFNSIIDDIAKAIESTELPDFISGVDNILSNIKNGINVYPMLVNYKLNKALLKTIVHRKFLDMAVIYYYLLGATEDGSGTVKITNSILEKVGISEEELYEMSFANMLKDSSLKTMAEVIAGLMGKEELEEESANDNSIPEMYCLTNSFAMSGAVHMLDFDTLDKVCIKNNCTKLYILPSSIHECLLIPIDSSCEKIEMINNMICSGNIDFIDHEEILSDHVYIYDMNKREISM